MLKLDFETQPADGHSRHIWIEKQDETIRVAAGYLSATNCWLTPDEARLIGHTLILFANQLSGQIPEKKE